MKILSLDVGKKGGVVIFDTDKREYELEDLFSFHDSMLKVKEYLSGVMLKYKPALIVIGEAFGQRAVVKKHSKFYGVIELVAEINDTAVIYYNDVSCRAVVLGKGNGRDKEMVWLKAYPLSETQDIADAKLFIDKYLIDCKITPMYETSTRAY